VPNNVPTNGLIGYWPFSGNANDSSGNNYNGTVNGATLTTDQNGNVNSAYSFDGVNDFISLASYNFFSGNSTRSISFWIQTNQTQNGIPVSSGGGIEYVFATNKGLGIFSMDKLRMAKIGFS
jgi:hypothetical protein